MVKVKKGFKKIILFIKSEKFIGKADLSLGMIKKKMLDKQVCKTLVTS
jgi:hypothetical protein